MKLVKFLSVGLICVLAFAVSLISAAENPTAIHIQRTMKALEESTAENPAHLRVMFYGQTITAQRWTQEVEEFFREKYPTDIVVMGIGENGHIAFNDPGVADFNDPVAIKPAKLDDVCRMQQVHDGCFAAIDEVPTHAFTLTCPTLVKATYTFCIVPAPTQAAAVAAMLKGPITDECPATLLRTVEGAVLYLEPDSASSLV